MKLLYFVLIFISIQAVLGSGVAVAATIEVQTPMRGVLVNHIPDRFIEVPNPAYPIRNYGDNIRNKLMDVLFRSGKVVLINPEVSIDGQSLGVMEFGSIPADPCLMSGKPIASVKIKITINQLYFSMGYGPLQKTTGFVKSTENYFNSGLYTDYLNEFPESENNFGNAFLEDGDLHTGLDLADQVNFDVLLAGLKIKHVPYYASLGIQLEVEEAFQKKKIYSIETHGNGFYFDFAGHFFYAGADFQLGIGIARDTALKDAFDRLIDKLSTEIFNKVKESPTIAKYTGVCNNQPLLGIGTDFSLSPGDRFYNRSQYEKGFEPDIIIVNQVFARTSSFVFERHFSQTPASQTNDQFVLLGMAERPPTYFPPYVPPGSPSRALASTSQPLSLASSAANASSVNSIESNVLDAGQKNLPISPSLAAYQGKTGDAWQTIVDFFTLPYRIYRFFKYNQTYHDSSKKIYSYSELLPKIGKSWKEAATQYQLGIEKLFTAYGGKPKQEIVFGNKNIIVAVIDSGVDYNNNDLKHSIFERFWSAKTIYGWDFFSADASAYDDHAHGTEVASMIVGNGDITLGFAPNITLLPMKAFSPYGATTSAALYSSFQYAISWGAQIIVTGWATEKQSKALALGVELARQNNVLVVAAAGDLGKNIDDIPAYPAAYSRSLNHVVSVGSHDRNFAISKPKTIDEVNAFVFPANFGNTVDLYAPGYKLKVSRPRDSSHVSSHSGLSAGQVAGAAALGMSYCMDRNVKLDPIDIKNALIKGSREMSGIKTLNLPGFIDQILTLCH